MLFNSLFHITMSVICILILLHKDCLTNASAISSGAIKTIFYASDISSGAIKTIFYASTILSDAIKTFFYASDTLSGAIKSMVYPTTFYVFN